MIIKVICTTLLILPIYTIREDAVEHSPIVQTPLGDAQIHKGIEDATNTFMEYEELSEIKESASEINDNEIDIDDTELELLARLINAEAGSSWATDEHQQLVGAVAMNRVKSDRFPDTLYDVIYQKGQYACTWDGNFEKEPSDRAIENAEKVLRGEIDLPENVVFQAQFKQGVGVYKKYHMTNQ